MILKLFLLTLITLIDVVQLQNQNQPADNDFKSVLTVSSNSNEINSGDTVQCRITNVNDKEVELIKRSEVYNKEYITIPENAYKIWLPYFENCLSFRIKAPNDHTITIALTTEENHFDKNAIEIVIGNYVMIKRNCNQKNCEFSKYEDLPNLLSADEYRGFWINWQNNNLRVGKEDSTNSFISYNVPYKLDINYIGLNASYERVPWLIDEPKCKGFKSLFSSDDVQKTKAICSKETKLSQIDSLRNLAKVYLNEIKSDNEYYNRVNYRSKSLIEKVINDLDEVFSKSNNLSDIMLDISPTGYHDEETFQIFSDIKQLYYSFYSTLQFEIEQNSNDMSKLNLIPPNENSKIITLNTKKYDFYRTKSDCFKVKVAVTNDFNLALASAPNKNSILYEIILGGWFNTKSGILKNQNLIVESVSNQILSDSEYHGFWINWRDRILKVGRDGDSQPFLLYEDIDLIHFNYTGVRSNGAPGTWINEDAICPP